MTPILPPQRAPRRPTVVGFGWSAADDQLFSRAIRYMTRPGLAPWGPRARWSHMFLVFNFEDYEGGIIHEALGSKGWRQQSAANLARWIEEGESKHRACIEWLDVPEAVVGHLWDESCSWLGTRSYAWRQIAVLAATHLILGRLLRPCFPRLLSVDLGETEVMCAEGAGQLVGRHWQEYDLRRRGESWAMMSPEDWWTRYQALLRAQAAARTGTAPAAS